MSVFDDFKAGLLNLDPVYWAEQHLYLDGKPFRLNNSGYKHFIDVYRYIGIKSIERDAKPIVIVKGRQVGGTIMSCILSLYFTSSGLFGFNNKPPMRILHCFPHEIQANDYAKTKLATMISASSNNVESVKKIKNQSFLDSRIDKSIEASNKFKRFLGGNDLRVDFCGLTGDRLRTNTFDGIFFDETQDIRGEAISTIVETMKQAQYGRRGAGIQVYFGTPKKKGSEFHRLWEKSSKQYYYLKCCKCEEYFPLYTPGTNEWEDIWITGFDVKCLYCGHVQNKIQAIENGKWIASNPDADYVGFHINQLFMPELNKEFILAQRPENNPFKTERMYNNEVLGEFYSGSNVSLSIEEIEAKCADLKRKIVYSIPRSRDARVYAGFDWGQKMDPEQIVSEADKVDAKASGGLSLSCAVILIPENNFLSVQFGTKFKKNSLSYKKELIDEIMRQFNVTVAVGDIGNANDLLPELQSKYGERFLASQSCTKIVNYIKYDQDVFPKIIKFQRNVYIEELLDLLKEGRIKFPYDETAYDKMYWLIEHCANLEPVAKQNKLGDVEINYVRGSGYIDGFMALLNAYLAWKYDTTNKFTSISPTLVKVGQPIIKQPPAVLAYMPNKGKKLLNQRNHRIY